MQIEVLNKINQTLWNDFLVNSKKSDVFFTLEFRELIRRVFGYEDLYYLIKNNGRIIGVAPFFLVKSSIFGDRIISLPFCDSGGICFADNTSINDQQIASEVFLKDLSALCNLKQVSFAEIRGQRLFNQDSDSRLCYKQTYVNFILSLKRDSWAQVAGGFSRNIKRILKHNVSGLAIDECKTTEDIALIYNIYVENLRKLGSPSLALSFFEKQWEIFAPGKYRIFIARYKGRVVGAITLLIYKNKVLAQHLFSVEDVPDLAVKIRLYYFSIKWAFDQKMDIYNFCRTRKNSGVFMHKKKWGASEETITYTYLLTKARKVLEIDYNNKRFNAPKIVIRHLPLFLLKKIGPFIRKQAGK